MTFAYQTLIHTPVWVFPLFAYLVWQGIKAMRPRTTAMWRSLVVPAVFIVWGLSRLLSGYQHGIGPLLSWSGAALALTPVGLLTAIGLEPAQVEPQMFDQFRTGSLIHAFVPTL